MNCHHARQLISPYLDQQLTGREMLALQDHFSGCASCEREMQSIRQVKALLRGLREPGPPRDFSDVIALRLEQAQTRGRYALRRPSVGGPKIYLAAPRPQRGRRLAGALVLSCVTVVSFALPFAPEARQAARSSSAMLGSSLGTGSSAFGVSSETDALLLGRVPERILLTPATIPVSDLAHLSLTGPTAPAAGTLTLAGMNTPPLGSSLEMIPRDASFGTVQFAEYKPR